VAPRRTRRHQRGREGHPRRTRQSTKGAERGAKCNHGGLGNTKEHQAALRRSKGAPRASKENQAAPRGTKDAKGVPKGTPRSTKGAGRDLKEHHPAGIERGH
jgi:hypothetical protein